MRASPAILLAVALSLPALAPASTDGCTCELASANDGWCRVHRVGYVGAVRIDSERLFDALDAHGHEVDTSTFRCDSCQAAVRSDGFCETHRVGFVRRQAYFSKLTHHLAKGDRKLVSEIECPTCRKNAETSGWCAACGRGMVGPVAIAERSAFDEAADAIRVVRAANEAAARCEDCALAIVTDTRCPRCRISYRDGRPVVAPPD